MFVPVGHPPDGCSSRIDWSVATKPIDREERVEVSRGDQADDTGGGDDLVDTRRVHTVLRVGTHRRLEDAPPLVDAPRLARVGSEWWFPDGLVDSKLHARQISGVGDAADRLEILDLLARYSFGADGADPADYAAVFTEDGAFHGRGGQPDEVRYEGRAALAKFATRAIAGRGDRQGRHHQSSTTFVEIGPDRAVTRSYLMTTAVRGESAPALGLTSIYEDHLVRTDDGWRIALRRALPDVTGTLAERLKR